MDKNKNTLSAIATNFIKSSMAAGSRAIAPLLAKSPELFLANLETNMLLYDQLADSVSGIYYNMYVYMDKEYISAGILREEWGTVFSSKSIQIFMKRETAEAIGKTIGIVIKGIPAALIITDASKEIWHVFNEYYDKGDYRTGSKELISYASLTLGAIEGSALFSMFIAATGPVGIAATVIGTLTFMGIGALVGSKVGDNIGDWICDLLGYTDADYDAAGSAVRYVADPLVIDLDGDGFELLSLANGVYFNENAEGLIEKTQWVAPDDALLAIDLNDDGIINDGSELFGTSTTLADGSKAKSGFEALAQYDENGDGIIDENDAAYSKLLIWRDMNSDGVSQEKELVSLQEVGIQSISLSHYDEDGRQVAGITFNDGRESKIGEFNFEAQLYNTKELEEYEISEEIRTLANVRAIGNVASLHTMMQADESGILKGYVETFSLAETTAEKEELLTKILYRITGAENVKSNSRGGLIDAKKLTVIEAFMGRDFVGISGSNPVNTAAAILGGMYSDIYEIYYNLMNAETSLKNYLGMTFWIKDENGNRYLDTSFFYAYVDFCRKEGNDMTSAVADMGRYIAAINAPNKGNLIDYVSLYEDNTEYLEAIKNSCSNVLIGIDKGETLKAGVRDTYLIGVGGDNFLYGGNGDDYLRGSKGNDYLEGGAGRDTYRFDLGWGNDRINNSDLGSCRIHDCIEFGEGIDSKDLYLTRSGSDLIITHMVSGDQIKVVNAYLYTDGRYFLDNIRFSNGTKWGLEEISEKVAETVWQGSDGNDTMLGYNISYGYSSDETFHGGAGNDTIKGNGGNDIIYGEEGNDNLDGGYGDDYLEGGTGDDYLEGGEGKDIYHFDLGWGNDRINNCDFGSGRIYDCIEFGEGIRAEDLSLVRSGSDLVITHMVNGDQIKVVSAYQTSDGRYFLEKIRFCDGTEWGLEEITEKVAETVGMGSDDNDTMFGYNSSYGYSSSETFHGGAGNDTIRANEGNDIIYGEEGNDKLDGGYGDDYLEGGTGDDYLEGGDGKDTYHFDLGWGNDRINNCDFGSGRIYDCIEFGDGIRAEDLRLIRSGSDLVITHIESGDQIKVVSAYQTSDGRYFLEKIRFCDGTEWGLEEITEKVAETVWMGSNGNDTMFGYNSSYGYSSDETFHGGAGNDTIRGNGGNDIIYGEEGNDSLDGGYGDDYLEGGTGDDYLEGGYGKDTYHFELGWGNDIINNFDLSSDRLYDRIEFGMGIYAKDLALERKYNNLIITSTTSGDTITIRDAYYYSNEAGQIDNVTFSDGTKGIIDYEHVEIVLEEPEVLEETEDNVIGNDENQKSENETSAEIITDITDTMDIDSSTDASAAMLTEVLDAEMTENEDIVHMEESVLADIMAEENSSNMDESTDLQAMLMVQELSGAEDNNICSNDMDNNIYEMPLFTEQFAVAE